MPYKDPEKQKAAQKKYEEKRKKERAERKDFWLFIFYPESAPENWRDIISEWQIECLVSPLHDQDVNPDGKLKKAHYHGIIFFESLVTKDAAWDVIKSLKGPMPIRPAGSKRTACEYLIHRQNPEKFQYKEEEVLEFGGASFKNYTIRDDDNDVFISEMMDFIDKYECYSYKTLMQYARRNRPEWFRALCRSCSYVIKEYIKSSFQESLTPMSYCKCTLQEIEEREDSIISEKG